MNFLDLFAGIGGFRLGMEMAGHKCIGYVECDPKCEDCKTYTQHYPHPTKTNVTICSVCGKEKTQYARESYQAIHNTEGEWTANDITTVTDDDIRNLGRERGPIQTICGGFPCQAFSIAGKRRGFEDARGTLFFEVARFASILRPKYLFLENVDGLRSHEGGRTLATILNILGELNYDVQAQVLNSKNFGVPQNRERIFFVCFNRDFGTESRPQVFPIGGSNKQTLKQIIGGSQGERVYDTGGVSCTLSSQGGGQGAKTGLYMIGNVNPSGNGMNGNVWDSKGLSPTLTTNKGEGLKVFIDIDINKPKITENARCLQARYNKGYSTRGAEMTGVLEVRPCLTPNRPEKRQNGRRFKESGEPMFTLTAQDIHGIHDGCRIRKLTPKECWRLQGFPDWAFDKAQAVNSDSQLYKQAGNSVTVNVIYEIARRLM